MQRDYSEFPKDENGEVLWGLKSHGDDFSVARDVEFCLDFSEEEAALRCGAFLFKNSYRIELDPPFEDDPKSPWTVVVYPFMKPNYSDICSLEEWLVKVATQFGGKCSGWGCETAGAP